MFESKINYRLINIHPIVYTKTYKFFSAAVECRTEVLVQLLCDADE